jgi:2-iminobutanoate/2-iminopropanoate deaminase
MNRRAGNTDQAPPVAGPYSQSVRIGNIVAAAGQAGIAPNGVTATGIEDQTRQAFENVVATLGAVGATMEDVIHVRVYLTDPTQFSTMNAVYSEFFQAPYPARTTVYVQLPRDLLVEVDALAVVAD